MNGKALYIKAGDGFHNGQHYADGDSLALTAAEARHGLIQEIIRPASKAAKKALEGASGEAPAGAGKKGGK